MSKHHRKGLTLGAGKVLDCGYCPAPCGKLAFDGKDQAKKALKQRRHQLARGGPRMHVYRCPIPGRGRYWHFGHMPQVVTEGEVARGDVGSPRGRRPNSR